MSASRNGSNVYLLATTLSTGGAEQVFDALARGLPARGFSPRVVCLHGPGAVGAELAADGVAVTAGLSRGRLDPFVPFKLASVLRGDRRAILCSLDHHDAVFWGAVAAGWAGLGRTVVALHSTGLWNRKRSFTLSDRVVMPRYAKVVALAETHARYLETTEGVDPGRIEIINNGVDTTRFRPAASAGEREAARSRLGIPMEDFVVAIVAVLRPEKNHEMLLRAAADIIERDSPYTFLIIGGGAEEGALRRTAASLGVGGAVRFLGLRDDVPDILRAVDCSVLCSYPVVETFPLAVLEAMASGLPVIATAVGSIPEMIESTVSGILIESGDTGALAAEIMRLKGNRRRCAEIGARARRRVADRFSIARMVDGYAALFSELEAGER
jgi:glycosyltransferase involved in cell wall biosynthesis